MVTTQSVCDQAQTLTDAGHPEKALALIAAYRTSIPKAPASTAPTSPPGSTSSSTATPTPSPTVATVCEPERLAALAASSQVDDHVAPSSGWPIRFQFYWNRFVDDIVTPLQSPLTTAAVTLLVLLIVARLAVYAPKMPPQWLQLRFAWVRSVICMVALATMVSATAALIFSLTTAQYVAATISGLVALLGTWLLSSVMASRLRVSIEVQKSGAVDLDTTAEIVALVAEIGGARPQGPQIPTGSDLTALKDTALSVQSSNAFVNALQWIANTVFTTTPWHVLVGATPATDDGGAQLSLVITRNLKRKGAFIIAADMILRPLDQEPDPPHSDTPGMTKRKPNALDPFLLEFAAAAIVTTLAREYSGFEGLCGAQDWRSVGLQYVAATRTRVGDLRLRLLLKALDWDPDNLLAAQALAVSTYDAAQQNPALTEAEQLEAADRYLGWLRDNIRHLLTEPGNHQKVRAGNDAAYRRMLYSELLALLNRHALRPDPNFPDERVRTTAEHLMNSLKKDKNARTPLVRQMRPTAILSYATVFPKSDASHTTRWDSLTTGWLENALQLSSPEAAINGACYFSATWKEDLRADEKRSIEEKMKERLRIARLDPALRVRAWTDPVLKKHITEQWFIDLMGPASGPPATPGCLRRLGEATRRRLHMNSA
ncbi:hypothetical protein [Leifsonia sp. 2MCAF36]|uniref:hypothetical protein n=1 Tax=Leifsonia sp. 2MCAF36 TaxID=3232988 RepID=UPI003F97AB00